MDLINKIKNKVSRKERLFIIFFSLALIFNFFIFNQFDVMLHNQNEFGVTIKEAIWPFIWCTCLVWLITIGLLLFLCYRFKTKFRYCIAILLGLMMAGYCQVLFFNDANMLNLRGTAMYFNFWLFTLNLIIYTLIFIIPFVFIKLEKKKKIKNTSKLAVSVSIVILGMQLIGVFSASITTKKPAKNNELYYFSIDDQLELSNKENIIVFVLDRFDTMIADTIFENHPESRNIFNGFTYYTNNISEYPGTFPSVISMLTNKKYDKNTNEQIKYLRDAWHDETLINELHEKNYRVNGLLDSIASFYDFKDLEGKFDNIKMLEKKNKKIKDIDYFSAMLSFAQVRQSPYALKEIFTNPRYLDIPNYCVEVKNTPDYFPRTISGMSDLKFYNKLKNTGLSLTESKNVFSFIHLQAAHNPYLYNEDLRPAKIISNSGADKQLAQAYGSFKILNEYFNQMKELGIYDKSTIVLLGDHGFWENNDELVNAPTTTLLIKEKGKGNEELETDAHTQLSHFNLSSTIFELIGAEDKKIAPSYFDVRKNGGIQTRYFYYVSWINLNSSKYRGTYEVNGNANDAKNWKKID